jgi:hypothetical protein
MTTFVYLNEVAVKPFLLVARNLVRIESIEVGAVPLDNPVLGKERVDKGLKTPCIGEQGGLAAQDNLVATVGAT